MISKNIQDDVIKLARLAGQKIMEIYEKDFSVFEKVNQLTIPYKITPRRSGDIAEFFSNSNKANMLLNWSAEKDIGDMCRDT